jgi:hypothetical protein
MTISGFDAGDRISPRCVCGHLEKPVKLLDNGARCLVEMTRDKSGHGAAPVYHQRMTMESGSASPHRRAALGHSLSDSLRMALCQCKLYSGSIAIVETVVRIAIRFGCGRFSPLVLITLLFSCCYSIVKYTYGEDILDGAIDFDSTEKTWNEDANGYKLRLGPCGPRTGRV